MLSEAGYQTRYRTSWDGWHESLQAPSDLVVVVGGDGTVGPVARALGGHDVPFTILPVGTANNIAKTFGIAGDGRAAVAAWASTTPQPLDIWAVTAGEASARFVESMGAGPMVPPIAASAWHTPPTFVLGGALDRARHTFCIALAAAPVAHWTIEADGRDLSGEYLGLEAMNTRSVGPNLPFAPEADPGDGAIDLVLIRESDRGRLHDRLRRAAVALSPCPLELPSYRCRELRLAPPPGITIHADSLVWPSEDRPGTELHVRHVARSRIVAPAG